MITIVPEWLWDRIDFETKALSWLVIIIKSKGGKAEVWKDKYGKPRMIDNSEILEIVGEYANLMSFP